MASLVWLKCRFEFVEIEMPIGLLKHVNLFHMMLVFIGHFFVSSLVMWRLSSGLYVMQ